MRKTALAAVVLAIAVVLQLTMLNGLRLPGSGVPDLVLLLVAVLAMTGGPVRGMVTGFAAGLVLDLAPPGSAVLGEYALVFCLVGWAAGKCRGLLAKSAVLSIVVLGLIVAVGEVLVAGLDLALDPAQVSLAQVRRVLPYSIGYDLAVAPFLLILTLLAALLAQRRHVDVLEAAGAVAARSAIGMPAPRWQPREPRLDLAVGRPHDGWVGSRPPGLTDRPGARWRPITPHKLRPANGVAGSALTGPARHPGLAARPVNLRLAAGRRGDGMIGSALGVGAGRHAGPHPARSAGAGRAFRPQAGVPGGSAAGQFAALARNPWQRPVSMGFSTRRKDASIGRLLGSHLAAASGPRIGYPVGHRGLGRQLRRSTGPRFRHSPSSAPRSRKKAAPRFRRVSTTSYRSMTAGLAPGGTMNHAAVLAARRRHVGTPRLRLSAGHRGDGALGGSALGSPVRGLRRSVRPAAAPRFRNRPGHSRSGLGAGKQPRFGYGRHSVLSFLASRRIGGKWLATSLVGTRSGVWVVSRRTGGPR